MHSLACLKRCSERPTQFNSAQLKMFKTRKKNSLTRWVKLSRVVRVFRAPDPTQLNQLSWVEWVGCSEQSLTVHKWMLGDVLFYLKFWAKLTRPLQKRQLSIDRSRIAKDLSLREKRSNITNRKSTKAFLISLRWTANVAPKLPKRKLKNAKWP